MIPPSWKMWAEKQVQVLLLIFLHRWMGTMFCILKAFTRRVRSDFQQHYSSAYNIVKPRSRWIIRHLIVVCKDGVELLSSQPDALFRNKNIELLKILDFTKAKHFMYECALTWNFNKKFSWTGRSLDINRKIIIGSCVLQCEYELFL